jgi:hypothetical protein
VLAKAVRTSRPQTRAGLPERGVRPAFSTADDLLLFAQREDGELVPEAPGSYLANGSGYLARLGQWIRESF